MGNKRKREKILENETEQTERRRSSRIIALEEKKKKEREKKALAKKNKANTDKGKGKAIIDDAGEGDFNDEKGHKCKPLHQLISSTKSMQEGREGSTSGTNVSSMNSSMPEKHVLEFILDLLQRKDPEELFAEPVNPDMVENDHKLVKQSMDFGTMRAKLHENMYTNLEQFKEDVYLICSNAMNTNPASTKHHKLAEAINGHARRVFEGLNADPEHFDLEFSLNKRRPCKKPQVTQPRTSRHARLPPKPAGKDNATQSMLPEIEKRDMYRPPSNKSLLSEFPNANKADFQLNPDAGSYEDSLLKFVEHLGPIAQKIAAKKLEALKFQQFFNGDPPTQNLLENVSGIHQITLQPTPQAPGQPHYDLNNVHKLSLALPFFNRPLTIPGTAARENRNVIHTIAGSVNSSDEAYKGRKVGDGWDACAAAFFGNFFLNYDRGASSSSGLKGESSNIARGTLIDILGPYKEKMVSPFENTSSLLGPVQEGTSTTNQNQLLQLGANYSITGKTAQWNSSAGIPEFLKKYTGTKDVNERSSQVITQVWPTRVISGPQIKPLEPICGNSLSVPSLTPQPRAEPEDSIFGMNIDSELSLVVSQRRPLDSMPGINLSGISLDSHPRPTESMSGPNLLKSGLSLLSQSRPEEPMSGNGINLSEAGLSLWSQSSAGDSMSGNGINLSEVAPFLLSHESGPTESQAAMFSKWNEPDTTLYGLGPLGTPYQQGDFQSLLGSTDFNNVNNPYPLLHASDHEQILNQEATPYTAPTSTYGFSDLQIQLGQLNTLDSFPLQEQPNSSSAFEMPLAGAMNYHGGGATAAVEGHQDQLEDIPQLLWDNYQQPNLALQL